MIFTPYTYVPRIYGYVGTHRNNSVLTVQFEALPAQGNTAVIIPILASTVYSVHIHMDKQYFLTSLLSQHQMVSDFPASMDRPTVNDDNLDAANKMLIPELRSEIEDVENYLVDYGVTMPEEYYKLLKFYYPGYKYLVSVIRADSSKVMKTIPVSVIYSQPRVNIKDDENWVFFPSFQNSDDNYMFGSVPSSSSMQDYNMLILTECKSEEGLYTELLSGYPEFLSATNKLHAFTNYRRPNGDMFFNSITGEVVLTSSHLTKDLPTGSAKSYVT